MQDITSDTYLLLYSRNRGRILIIYMDIGQNNKQWRAKGKSADAKIQKSQELLILKALTRWQVRVTANWLSVGISVTKNHKTREVLS